MEFNGKKLTAFGLIEAEWSGEVNALATQLQEHKDDTDNPHATTPENIGAVPAADVADFVVEHVTDGNWTWEKWNSGKAVCWGVFTLGDVAVANAWGNWYESAEYTQALPTGLFVDAPQILDITVRNSDSALFVARYGDSTAESTGVFTLSRPTSRTCQGVAIGLYAIGSWQ